MKILQEKDIAPIYLRPQDTIKVSYTDSNGTTSELIEATVDKEMFCDVVYIIQLEDEFGLECGIGGIIGKRK